jgi:predicted amidohydrolase YtcJ
MMTAALLVMSLYPDVIYLNGTVITMDARQSEAQAVAVRGDAIVAVGDNNAIEDLAGPDTERIDLEGATLLPGFYAAHDHFPGSGVVALFRVDLNSPPIGEINTMDELVARLAARANETPKGQWVRGRGYDDTLIREKRHPTRADLDRASTEHPIYIGHISGHLGVANSLALEMAGITKETPEPSGGVIRKDPETGEPNGVFEESMSLVTRLIPPLDENDRLSAIRWAVTDYVEEGVTTTVIAHGSTSTLRDLQRARGDGLLSLRVISMGSKGSLDAPSPGEAGGFVSGFGDTRLKLGAVKVIQDGSIQGFTGYLVEPYYTPFKGDASYRGYPRRERGELVAIVKSLHRAGYQIAIHGNGDAAIDDILFAFREAQKEFPRVDARHRIEHCQMAREDQLDEMQELGITPSFFIGHAYYWGDRHRDIFMGPERAARLSPLKSAVDRGIRFTVHDDTPVTPVKPIQLVWDAVNRITTSGKVLGPAQRISPYEALRSVTIDAAWQNFEEDIKGSIEVGKLADFVVLEENPLTVDPEHIRDIRVLATVVGGETVYDVR